MSILTANNFAGTELLTWQKLCKFSDVDSSINKCFNICLWYTIVIILCANNTHNKQTQIKHALVSFYNI